MPLLHLLTGWFSSLEPSRARTSLTVAESLLNQLLSIIESLIQMNQSDDRILDELDAIAQAQYSERLSQTPIDSLVNELPSDVMQKLRGANMDRIAMILILDVRSLASQLNVTMTQATKIYEAADQVAKRIRQQPVQIPTAENTKPKQARLLRATYVQIRSRHIPQGLLQELQSAYRGIERAMRTTKLRTAILSRLFFGNRSLAKSIDELNKVLNTVISSRLPEVAQAIVRELTPPDDFDELLDDYHRFYADYGTAIDRTMNNSNRSHAKIGVVQGSKSGQLSSRLAESVDSLELDFDGLKVALRLYQEFGVKFMVKQRRTILADEMGLGKTIQAIATIVHLRNREHAERFLIIAPAGLLQNWKMEIEKMSDLSPKLLHGIEKSTQLTSWLAEGGVALVSFETSLSIKESLAIPMDLLIVDEGHMVKNPAAARSKAVQSFAENCNRLAILTGTPLENNTDEFANLIRICNPMIAQRAVQIANKDNEDGQFELAIESIYLRRTQEDVLKDLDETMEREEWVELSEQERREYQLKTERMGQRQAANGSIKQSSKLNRLNELLNLYKGKRRVLVFSKFLATLDMIKESVGEAYRIDGSVPSQERPEIIQRFSKCKGFAPLLCQIDAAGVGLNIQAASVVILFEPSDKPTTEWQAIARAQRMGQSKRVHVHRLFAKGTIEETMRDRLGFKEELFEAYVEPCMAKVKNANAVAAG